MSELQTLPSPSLGTSRLDMPPIDTITPSEEECPKSRRDDVMMKAFGLENDIQHWSRMKADGKKFCQEELPPKRSGPGFKQRRLMLANKKRKKLLFSGTAQVTKDYLWEFGLAPWKERYDYDIQYLQKRFPNDSAKSIICGIFSEWNHKANVKTKIRKYADGRDLHRLYADLSAKRDAEANKNTDDALGNNNTPMTRIDGSRNSQITHADIKKVRESPSSLSLDRKHRAPPKEGVREYSNTDWSHVVLNIQHEDQTKGALDRLPFSFICGPEACIPSNIQMNIIKEKLREQGVAVEDYFLRLSGSLEDVDWDLSDVYSALTTWCRSRSSNELDVPLLLVPRSGDFMTELCRYAKIPVEQIDPQSIATDGTSQDDDTSITQSDRDDLTPSPQPYQINTEMAENSAENQAPNRAKRKRKGPPPAARSDCKNRQTTYLD